MKPVDSSSCLAVLLISPKRAGPSRMPPNQRDTTTTASHTSIKAEHSDGRCASTTTIGGSSGGSGAAPAGSMNDLQSTDAASSANDCCCMMFRQMHQALIICHACDSDIPSCRQNTKGTSISLLELVHCCHAGPPQYVLHLYSLPIATCEHVHMQPISSVCSMHPACPMTHQQLAAGAAAGRLLPPPHHHHSPAQTRLACLALLCGRP